MEELRIDANGLSFAAVAWGDSGDPLVLCLHGYPDTAWTWRRVGPLLAERGMRVVAPFMRGYGPTDLAPDGDYSAQALAADAVALRGELADGGRPATLVGHDWGALAAYGVPEGTFDRVVTLAVPPPETLTSVPPALLARQLRSSWYMGFNQIRGVAERMQDRLVPALWRTWSPGYDATDELARLRESWAGRGRRAAALGYYRALRPSGLPGRSTPSTYLHGERDGCVLPEVARRAGAEIVGAAGHFIHLERPDVVVERVTEQPVSTRRAPPC